MLLFALKVILFILFAYNSINLMLNLGSFFRFDSLTIYDGGSTTSDLIGKLCGNSLPPGQILSSTHELLFHFQTDFSGVYDGFHIDYSTLCKSHRFILFATNKNSISFKFKLVQMDIWLEMASAMMKQTTQNATLMVGIAADCAL